MSDQYPGDDEFARILSVIDEPGDDVPPTFADALWAELHAGLRQRAAAPGDATADGDAADDATADDATADGGAADGDAADVVRLSPPESIDRNGHGRRPWRPIAAAAAVVVLVGLGVIVAGDDGPDVSTGSETATDRASAPPEGPGPQVLIDPVAACERYLATRPTLTELVDQLEAGPPPTPADLDVARRAIETLTADLEASGLYLDIQYSSLGPAAASLGQARSEIAAGELERAIVSVSAASNQLNSVDLPGITSSRDVCAPIG